MSKRGGTIELTVDGEVYLAKGEFTTNIGENIRAEIVGQSSIHGYAETPGVPMVEGTITDTAEIDLAALQRAKDATIVVNYGTGKSFMLSKAWYAGDGNRTSGEGEFNFKFVSSVKGVEF